LDLSGWQVQVVDEHAGHFLKGLIQADGCRVLNRVAGRDYPRYYFSNRSEDLHRLFASACQRLGVCCRRSSPVQTTIGRRADVARIDAFVGPKA